MKFNKTEVIPDLPEALMRVCEAFGVPVYVETEHDVDDDHNDYLDMRITLDFDDMDGDYDDGVARRALTACPEYTAEFRRKEPYYQSWLVDAADEWVEEWAKEMERRFPKVRFT